MNKKKTVHILIFGSFHSKAEKSFNKVVEFLNKMETKNNKAQTDTSEN